MGAKICALGEQMSDNKLSRGQRLLIVFTGLRNITDLFLGAFLISFIMQRATNQIVSVSMYQLFHFTAVCFGFFAFAHWCKRYNKVSVFVLNIVPKIILLASIVYLGDRVVDYVIPLGFIYGLGSAMYHLPRNLMVGEQVSSDLMPHFISSQNIVSYIVKIVAPITLGLFITAGSYTGMACVLLVVSCIELLLSFMLTPSRHRTRAPLDFSGFFRCMMRFSVIKSMFGIEILRGFAIGLLDTVIPMFTVYMFKTDLNLGMFTTLFAIMSILASYVMGRFSKESQTRHIIRGCMLVIILGMAIFVGWTTPGTFLIYNFVYATAIVMLNQICESKIFQLSHSKCITANHKIEYFVFRDFALFLGRWVGFVGLMYIGTFGDYSWLRWYLVLISLALVAYGIGVLRLNLRTRRK